MLFNKFDDEDWIELGDRVFSRTLAISNEEDRKELFEILLQSELTTIALEQLPEVVQEMTSIYIDRFWNDQHSLKALESAIADERRDFDR